VTLASGARPRWWFDGDDSSSRVLRIVFVERGGGRRSDLNSHAPSDHYYRNGAEHCAVERVFLAGIPVRDDLILELARLVDDSALADRLEGAYGRRVKVFGLDIPERESSFLASCGSAATTTRGAAAESDRSSQTFPTGAAETRPLHDIGAHQILELRSTLL
jgi:hypothetical protein